MKKEFNKIARLEKAIREKYGEEAIQNPKNLWNQEKEEKYIKELKLFYKKQKKNKETINLNGFVVRENKFLSKYKIDRKCSECESYSFCGRDDLYMGKFGCCELCHIKYIDGREDRWNSGWRPPKK